MRRGGQRAPMSWRQDGELHFSHTPVGMWMIEQHRRRFKLTLDLKDTRDATQEMGVYSSLSAAKTAAQRNDRVFQKDLG